MIRLSLRLTLRDETDDETVRLRVDMSQLMTSVEILTFGNEPEEIKALPLRKCASSVFKCTSLSGWPSHRPIAVWSEQSTRKPLER